jgi:protein-disulfide isomerase
MQRLTRRAALACAILAGLAAAPAAAAPGVAGPGDMSLGNPQAPVKVVEYASASCSHCAHFNQTVWPAFKAKYVDTGRVHYTVKELLTQPQQVAAAGFLLARCNGAPPAKYFKILDEVFESQKRWQSGNIKPILVEIANANGISEAQFDACLTDQTALEALNGRVQAAIADGVRGTPTFYVNGKEVEVATLADLEAAVAAAGKGGGK